MNSGHASRLSVHGGQERRLNIESLGWQVRELVSFNFLHLRLGHESVHQNINKMAYSQYVWKTVTFWDRDAE